MMPRVGATLIDLQEVDPGGFIGSQAVDAAFTAIDAERKIEFDAKSNVRARELFGWFAWPGVGLCLAAFWLAPIGERRRATPNTPRTARSHA